MIQERRFERVGGSESLEADVRLIAATHRDLEALAQSGEFREDLLFRLSPFPLTLPKLAEREGDVALLAAHLLDGLKARLEMPELALSESALHSLEARAWPGNVRELSNTLERAAILAGGGRIAPRHLGGGARIRERSPEPAQVPGYQLPSSLGRLERAMGREILEAIAESGGKISGAGGAAESLGIPPTTLHSTIRRLGLRRVEARRPRRPDGEV